jgi:hypothetical protein
MGRSFRLRANPLRASSARARRGFLTQIKSLHRRAPKLS